MMIGQVVAGIANLVLSPSAGKVEGAATVTLAGVLTAPFLGVRLVSYGAAAIGWKVE
mgnify:FL=1